MQVVDKITMFQIAVKDMPKAKEFYADKLGLKVAKDYRMDDDNWWVSLNAPEGDFTMTLTTHHGNMKTGSIVLYFKTADIEAAHKELAGKGVKVGDVMDDLYGPGSGVKFFQVADPDENMIHVAAA
ncbi:MAG TPA: VOC family protein [Candidatus Saccharimonadia bacterium]|jgi:predicted enzyme related to lactoylglutathione lyase|nr:VOC family protein [Candidatus Saccharimonadia bacterium]